MTYYAHSLPDHPQTDWEPLSEHLAAVARRAEGFGSAFGADALTGLAGLWHDLGKASRAFQERVLGVGADEALTDDADSLVEPTTRGRSARVDHSTAGARHAVDVLGDGPLGLILAYAIAGHHGQLANWDGDGSNSTLRARLNAKTRRIENFDIPDYAKYTGDPSDLQPRGYTMPPPASLHAFRLSLLTRMIYSALVDADRLETERFYSPEKAGQRPEPVPLDQLLEQLNHHLNELRDKRPGDPSPVDVHRAMVLEACRDKAALPPGLFSLTVPTGGGKTLSSLAFALEHALRHDLNRVIYALPFTSIIEQTAETFRAVFNDTQGRIVLEHHSNIDPDSPTRRSLTAQLAAENWDAPIIVSTNVQLFESLFSAHGSTCRKLHRLAGSVIVLDEAQAIPPLLLRPVLATIDELVRNYRCSIVLCTATQPAVMRRDNFPIGLSNVTEIVPDPKALYSAMQRVRVSNLGPIEDDALAARLADHEQVLCIVNTRKHAAALAGRLRSIGEVIHLSAAMCPEHRSQCVARIKQLLEDREPCRVVSTQVIEAGVDVDFPVVYRALAGFDSIAQAAGRCNREGRRASGEVYVFDTDHRPAPTMLPNVHAANELLPDHPDPLALNAIEKYFGLVYWKLQHHGKNQWDQHNVMGCFEQGDTPSDLVLNFREADRRFRWIDQQTTAVIVPFDEAGRELIDQLRNWDDEPDWRLLRRAQRFSVAVYANQLKLLQDNTLITPGLSNDADDCPFWLLTNPQAYDNLLGLRFDVEGWDASALIG